MYSLSQQGFPEFFTWLVTILILHRKRCHIINSNQTTFAAFELYNDVSHGRVAYPSSKNFKDNGPISSLDFHSSRVIAVDIKWPLEMRWVKDSFFPLPIRYFSATTTFLEALKLRVSIRGPLKISSWVSPPFLVHKLWRDGLISSRWANASSQLKSFERKTRKAGLTRLKQFSSTLYILRMER